jgi:hypothetical protein
VYVTVGGAVVADGEDFPRTPQFVNDLEIDRQGKLYVSTVAMDRVLAARFIG